MFKLVVVLFTLNSVVVCNSKDYQQPAATSYAAREDGPEGKQYGFGFSKKFGYNKMIVTTFEAPMPEQASASYSNYVVHPVGKEHRGHNGKDTKISLEHNPIVIEDTAESSFLKLFPIVVEDSEETQETLEEPRNGFKGYREMVKQEDGDSFGSWFTREEPKGKNVLDEEVQDLYLAWFEKEGPRTKASEGYWKSFKNNFDTFYEDKFKQFFGDDGESDRYKESESDKKNDEFDWFPDIPYKYEYEDDSDGDSDGKNDKWGYYTYEPKDDFRRNFDFNDNDYGYRWWNEW